MGPLLLLIVKPLTSLIASYNTTLTQPEALEGQ